MKRILALLCAFAMAALPAGCAAEAEKAPLTAAGAVPVNVVALKGPTAMGMVRMMEQADTGVLKDNSYYFMISASVDEVVPKLAQGEADIAALPANLASVLYHNMEGGVQVLAVNTLGVLYIVERGGSVLSVGDLRGRTIYASGKGATPEYILNYILSSSGIDPAADVAIEWKSEHAECLAALTAQENAIAMLPQPFVATAQAKCGDMRVALDLTREWEALQAGSRMPSALISGVIVARTEFVEQNPETVSAFLDHYQESVDYVNGNMEEAARLMESYGIVPAEIALKALPACNITFLAGTEMREKLSGYLAVLLEQEPRSVGGALPGDSFYFNAR